MGLFKGKFFGKKTSKEEKPAPPAAKAKPAPKAKAPAKAKTAPPKAKAVPIKAKATEPQKAEEAKKAVPTPKVELKPNRILTAEGWHRRQLKQSKKKSK